MISPNITDALEMYCRAREYVHASGQWEEVEWHKSTSIEAFSESEFLREAAWVVLCSGFRESLVRKVFGHISLAYCDWESANAITGSYPLCKVVAKAAFANDAKNEAIVEIARRIEAVGFARFKQAIVSSPISELMRLPYIGKVTAWHLAKNLGLNVAKPDRHLKSVSQKLGFSSAASLCQSLGDIMGEQAKVVDLIVWRYLADNERVRAHWC